MVTYQKVINIPSHVTYKKKDGTKVKVRCIKNELVDSGSKSVERFEVCEFCKVAIKSSYTVDWPLRLSTHRVDASKDSEVNDPELDDTYYFCNQWCLRQWCLPHWLKD